MPSRTRRRQVSKPRPVTTGGVESAAADYTDLVIHGQRLSSREIEVRVYVSPAGAMTEGKRIVFTASEADQIRTSFYSGLGNPPYGRAEITQAEATKLGKRLAAVLLPAPVFRLLAQSLAEVLRKPSGGLRLRLGLD